LIIPFHRQSTPREWPTKELDKNIGDFISKGTVDTIMLGRKTYDWAMKQVRELPHADKNAYIITRTARPTIGKTVFYTGHPTPL